MLKLTSALKLTFNEHLWASSKPTKWIQGDFRSLHILTWDFPHSTITTAIMEADPFENVGGDSSDEEGAQSDSSDDGDSSGDDNPFEDPDNEDGEDENESDSDEDSPQNDLGLRFWMACSVGDIEAAKIALSEGTPKHIFFSSIPCDLTFSFWVS
jgi:hypothetical protein